MRLTHLLLSVAAGLAVSCCQAEEQRSSAATASTTSPPEPQAIATYAPMLAVVSPCVVTVYSTRTVKPEVEGNPLHGLDQDPFFQRFFGPQFLQPDQEPRRERGLGSGVIVRKDGYILTNNHVVEGADQVKIGMGDGSADIIAKVVGTDPQTDLAVLKIDPGSLPLPVLAMGSSAGARVGDVVFAVGNPFGVGETVTMGIISAVGRGGMHIEDYEDFLQTDAAVNPGNSGGALVTSDGRMVGINTAIISPTGGNLGIGFAIPSDLARKVMDSIISTGSVRRGYLGVMVQSITPELEAGLHLGSSRGALVGDVVPGSAAAAAGLQAGDVITKINETIITDPRHLRLLIGGMPPGARISLTYLKSGKEQVVSLALKEQTPSVAAAVGKEALAPEHQLGLSIHALDSQLREELKAPADVHGVVVTAVHDGTPAQDAGLEVGDVILAINEQPVEDVDAAAGLLKSGAGNLVLRVWSHGMRHFAVISTEPAPPRTP